jgi:hypothetical protein
VDEEIEDIISAELTLADTAQGSNDDQEEIGELEDDEYKEEEKEKVEDLDIKIRLNPSRILIRN